MKSNLKIYDKFGELYTLDCIAAGMYNVWCLDVVVGHFYYLHVGKNVKLTDIEVFDSCLNPGSRFLKLIRLKPQTISYRNKGIGTALLKFAFEHFRDLGCDCVQGEIVESDLAARPWLPDWYRRHGFDVPVSGIGMIRKSL